MSEKCDACPVLCLTKYDTSEGYCFTAVSEACANNQCENGRCRPNRRGTGGGYRCRCKKGWSGKFCNEGKKILYIFVF